MTEPYYRDLFDARTPGFGRPYGQPAGQATPGANKLSPPSGDHQAQGRGQ